MWFWILVVILCPLQILPFFDVGYIVVDVAETVYHVKELVLGRIPYRDIYSHHFLGYLLPFYIIELLVPLSPKVVWIISLINQILISVITYGILYYLMGASTARLGALLAVTVGWFSGWGGTTFNLQSYLAPILGTFVLLLVRGCNRNSIRSFYGAAVVYGFGIICDQRFIVFGLLWLYARSSLFCVSKCYALVAIAALALLPTIIAVSWLAWHGALLAFFEQTILFPFYYRNSGLDQPFAERVWQLFRSGFFAQQIEIVISGFGLVLLYMNKRRSEFALVALLFFCGLIYSVIGGRNFVHYLLIISLPMVISLSLLPAAVSSVHRRIVYGCMLVVALIDIWRPVAILINAPGYFIEGQKKILQEVGTFVKTNSDPEERILVWGYLPQLYLASERFSGFSDVGLISVVGANFKIKGSQSPAVVKEMEDRFKEYLEATPPSFILSVKFHRDPDGVVVNEDSWILPFNVGIQENMDYASQSYLSYFRDFIARNYELVMNVEELHAECFIFKKRKMPSGSSK